jgi:hypothetical protein
MSFHACVQMLPSDADKRFGAGWAITAPSFVVWRGVGLEEKLCLLCRNLTVSLWPASYRGVFFLFQIADEFRAPSLSVSEFPESNGRHADDRDERRRIFEGFAYVTGDEADRLTGKLCRNIPRAYSKAG